MDKGPWKKYDDYAIGIISEDFNHDVTLVIHGDFADQEEKERYRDWLLGVLNNSSSAPFEIQDRVPE